MTRRPPRAVGWPVTAKNTSSRSGVWIESCSTSMSASSSWSSSRRSEATPPSLGTWRTSLSSSRVAAVEQARRPRAGRCGAANCRRTWPPGMRRFSSSGVPSATIRPRSRTAIRSASWSASSRYWVVRKIVTPLGGQLADAVPHRAAAARVEPGRGLVEEDHRWGADQGHRQVEPAAHPARVGRDRPAAPRRRDRTGRAARRPGAARRRGRGGSGRPSAAGSPRRSAARPPPRTGR